MNTLSRYYRQPTFFIELPSKGQYLNLNEEDQSILSEVGIMPMTMLNQLTVNNPESLLNGHAVEQLINDCTTIKSISPKKLYKCDVDSLLTAIRKESIDETMDVEITCPDCEKKSTYGIDLTKFLINQQSHEELPYQLDIKVGYDNQKDKDIYITLNLLPSTYEQSLKIDQIFLQDAREIEELRRKLENHISEDGHEDDMTNARNHTMEIANEIYAVQERMTTSTIELYSNSIVYVTTPEGEIVDDSEEIKDFVLNLTSEDHKLLKNKISEINKIGIDRSYSFKCDSCEHEFVEYIEINPSDFFVNGSR